MITKTRKLRQDEINKNKKSAFEEGIVEWTRFYRANPHRFIIDYLGLPLFVFQMIIIFMFDKFNYNMLTCSRGTGKSYITSVYSCCRCILYPHTKIIIGASTKGQAKLIISQKIEKELMAMSPNLRREIKEVKCNGNEAKVTFHNGSTIEAVVSGEQSRGFRCNILIIDEFRLVSKEVTDRIMRPFLNVNRKPAFTMKPEYEGYPIEENKEIYLSSCYFKADDAYDKFKHYVKSMLRGEDCFVLNTDYKLAIHHGLLSEVRAEAMRKEMDEVSWAMEMESLWWGESESAFFKSAEVNPCRTLVKPFYPPTNLEYINEKDKRNKSWNITKQKGEIRIISADLALCEGKQNDNSVYSLFRLIPDKDTYKRQVVHIESYNGANSDQQSLRLKELYFDFEADKLILDATGIGMSVYEAMGRVQYCQERDIEYPGFCSYNLDNDKVLNKGSMPVIHALKVTNLAQNHEIAMSIKDSFLKKKIELLINDTEGKDYLVEKQGLLKKSNLEQARMLAPYLQTTAAINEIINLEYSIHNGLVKVIEKGTARKDRYSSIAYGNYLAGLIEKEEFKKKKRGDSKMKPLW